MTFPQKTVTLTQLANNAINWINNLTPNQITILTILAAIVIAENAPKSYSYNFYSKAKLILRKNFTDYTKKLAKFNQGQACASCRNYTEFLEFHHKDGNRANNSLENCQGLCPNCHAKIHRNKF